MSLTACTTLENRRDMYSPQTVRGPYTRMLHEGTHHTATVVTVEQTSSDYKSVR